MKNHSIELGMLVVLAVLAGCTTAFGGADAGVEDPQRSGQLQLPVGENAWSSVHRITITETVSPSTVTLEGRETTVFMNNGSEPVTIVFQDVEREFSLAPNQTISFVPANSIAFDAWRGEQFVGSGRIVVEK